MQDTYSLEILSKPREELFDGRVQFQILPRPRHGVTIPTPDLPVDDWRCFSDGKQTKCVCVDSSRQMTWTRSRSICALSTRALSYYSLCLMLMPVNPAFNVLVLHKRLLSHVKHRLLFTHRKSALIWLLVPQKHVRQDQFRSNISFCARLRSSIESLD